MTEIKMLAEIFLLCIGFGTFLFTPIANPKDTGAGLMKLMLSVAGGCLVLSLVLHLTYASISGQQGMMLGIAIVLMVFNYFFQKDQKTYLQRAIHWVASFLLLTAINRFANGHFPTFIFILSSALLLGAINYGMLLGHWYLVTPKLSEKPLKVCVAIIWAVLIPKMAWTAYVTYENAAFFTEGTSLGAGYSFNWMMLIMRYLWGYIIIAVMNFFTWKLVKMRSIQSATGILYAMVFFVLVGELISLYIYLNYGLYL
jgi:hypothetical protein